MYDCIIIGAGMSGLAAGIRLAMFGQRVCILERHYAVGGLNSYYRLGGRNYDVGLHALTNFAARGAKQGPLPRLLRQLRLRWDDWQLAQQHGSAIVFPNVRLRFTNDPALLAAEIERAFPTQREPYRRLLATLLDYDQLSVPQAAKSAREVLTELFTEPLLVEMLLCPIMFYGSAREHDLDWGSFSVLFRAIFLEGLARPRGGIRVILKQLVKRFKELEGELRLRAGVQRINADGAEKLRVVLDDGSEVTAREVISSAGWFETRRLCRPENGDRQSNTAGGPPAEARSHLPGRMSFIESILTLDCQPRELGFDDTIVFFNDHHHFDYARPKDLADVRSGIVCSPNNYNYADCESPTGAIVLDKPEPKIEPVEGTVRITALANYDRWKALAPEQYQTCKAACYEKMLGSAARYVPNFQGHIVTHDMFTPTTVVRYTGHDAGAVYGAPQKRYDAQAPLEHVWICGADQGYVGIVGTLTSGIHVANMLLRTAAKSD